MNPTPLRTLIAKNQGTVVPFRYMPLHHQAPVAQYLSLENVCWEIPTLLAVWFQESRPPAHKIAADRPYQRLFAQEFPRHMPWYAGKYGDQKFGVAEVQIADLIPLVMASADLVWYKSWEEYHDWYVNDSTMPDHDIKNLWAVWVDTTENARSPIYDGWHRFHDYARKGVQTVPVVYHEPPVWTETVPTTEGWYWTKNTAGTPVKRPAQVILLTDTAVVVTTRESLIFRKGESHPVLFGPEIIPPE